jgi:hypothetical protein
MPQPTLLFEERRGKLGRMRMNANARSSLTRSNGEHRMEETGGRSGNTMTGPDDHYESTPSGDLDRHPGIDERAFGDGIVLAAVDLDLPGRPERCEGDARATDHRVSLGLPNLIFVTVRWSIRPAEHSEGKDIEQFEDDQREIDHSSAPR